MLKTRLCIVASFQDYRTHLNLRQKFTYIKGFLLRNYSCFSVRI